MGSPGLPAKAPKAAGGTGDGRLDRHRLDNPGLRAAHLRNDIPPWTIIEDELFVFVTLTDPLRPRDLEDIAGKAIRVVRLLDVGPDQPAVEVPQDSCENGEMR